MAIHVIEEANRCLQCKVPRCQQGCPIHTNVPQMIRLFKESQVEEAAQILNTIVSETSYTAKDVIIIPYV